MSHESLGLFAENVAHGKCGETLQPFIYGTWLIYTRDMTHWYVWHDSLVCVTHNSCMCVAWLIHMFARTCTCRHLQCVHMCDMTYWYVWHDSLICVTLLIDVCYITHAYVCHDSFICLQGLARVDICNASICVTWPIDLWWLRLVGSVKS